MLTRTSLIGVALFTFVGCKGDNGNQSMDSSVGNGDDLSAGGGGNGMVMGHARILHGPSTVMRSRPLGGTRRQLPQAQAGHWALSPNQARVTVVSLTFQGTAAGEVQVATLSNCTPTYIRDQAALTSVLDCPFMIPAGTYAGMGIGVSTTFDVTVNDTVNGFYSDPAAPSKLSTTAPAGGAQSVSITVQGPGGTGNVLTQQAYFSHPITVTASGSVGGDDGGTLPGVTVDITEDLVHTLFADVAGNGTASFALSTPMPAVQMVASIEGAGHVAFYSQTGTAGSALMPGPTDDESSSVRVFYDGTGAASYVFHPTIGPSSAWNANPANSPGAGGMFRAGGYLGVDSAGTLCWAVPQDYTYATYSQLCELQTVSTVGATTTLRCQTMSSVPPPTSGDTYASGCPAITPTTTVPLTLVAN